MLAFSYIFLDEYAPKHIVMWKGVKGFCDSGSMNNLTTVQRRSLLKLISEPHTSNQSEEDKVMGGSSQQLINTWTQLLPTTQLLEDVTIAYSKARKLLH